MLDLLESEKCSYGSRTSAVMGLMIHLLMNVQRRTGRSWTFPLLKHSKELVLIVPVSKNLTTLEVVCILFRLDKKEGTTVLCRYFDKQGKSYPPFEVSIDSDGYFNDESSEEN